MVSLLKIWTAEGLIDYGLGSWNIRRPLNSRLFLFGEGTKIRFWKDSWFDVQPLAEKFSNFFSLSLNKDAFVADCWCNVSQMCSIMSLTMWPQFWKIFILGPLQMVVLVLNGFLMLMAALLWSLLFFNLTKSSPSIAAPLIHHIWKTKIPKEAKFFLWSLTCRSLNNHEKLQKELQHTILSPSMCCLCFEEEETLDHLALSLY